MLSNRKTGQYFQVFIVLFSYAISLSAFLWFYNQFPSYSAYQDILVWNAEAVGFLCRILGLDVTVYENRVLTGSISFEITPECTSLQFLAIFFAGIIAFPSGIREKFWGILLGGVVLSLLNLVRLMGLISVGTFVPPLLDSAHILVGQSLMIVAAVVLWVLWWRRTVTDEKIQP